MTPSTVKLISFKPLLKGVLRGFATVELPIGLIIIDCPVCSSHGRAWVSLPARPQLDSAGWPVMKDGRLQYVAVLRWRDRDLGDRFSAAVLDLIRAEHPDALADGSAP